MFENDVANFIRASGVFDSTVPIRIADLEAEEPNGIMVKSSLDGFATTPESPGYYRGSFQVIVRNTDPEIGNVWANNVCQLLNGGKITLTNYEIKTVYPYTTPIMYAKNLADLYEFSCNFQVAFQVL